VVLLSIFGGIAFAVVAFVVIAIVVADKPEPKKGTATPRSTADQPDTPPAGTEDAG
jgi:hypothetical protein